MVEPKPDAKPDGKPAIQTDLAPNVDMAAINEMKAMQKQLNDLQKEKDELQVEKDEIVKAGLLKDLALVNKASAERNKDASIERLQIALEEAKELRSDLPDFAGKKKTEPVKNPLDMGTFDPVTNGWIE